MPITAPSPAPVAPAGSLFTGRARWVVASLFLVGTALQAVEFALENPNDDAGQRVAYWVDHSTRVEWSAAAGILAVPFLIAGFAVMVALSRRASRWLAWTSAALLTLAMVGLAAIHGLELAAYLLAADGRTDAAVLVLDGENPGVAGAVLFVMFLAGVAFGILTLVAATWRSPLVPQAVPVLLLAFAVLDFGFGYGLVAHLVNVGTGLALGWAIVTGYTRATGPAS